MSWTTEQAIAALEGAMAMEVEGEAFYLQAAERTQDEKGKVMFRSLASDETEHYAKLKSVRDELAVSGTWLSQEAVLSRPAGRWHSPAVFDAGRLSRSVNLETGDAEALRLGMEVEHASHKNYAKNRDAADDPDAKALFAYLAEEEIGHYNLLEAALAYLEDTASFFLISERAINEG
ncbi:MAG: ferritin family protein [Chloroflexota bacterium]